MSEDDKMETFYEEMFDFDIGSDVFPKRRYGKF
jgi:hypothetical protein